MIEYILIPHSKLFFIYIDICSKMLCLSGGKTSQIWHYLQKLAVMVREGESCCFWYWRMLRLGWLINPKIKHSEDVKNNAFWKNLAPWSMKQTKFLIKELRSNSTAKWSKGGWADRAGSQSLCTIKSQSHFLMLGTSNTLLLGLCGEGPPMSGRHCSSLILET